MLPFIHEYFKKYKIRLFLTIITTLIVKVISVLNPLIYAHIIDTMTDGKRFELLLYLVVFMTAIMIINIFISYASNQFNIYIQTNVAFDMIKNLFSHIHQLQLYKISSINPAHLNEQINEDTNSLSSFILDVINNLIFNILTLVFIIFKIYQLDRILSLYLIIICFIYYILYILLKNKIYNISFELKEHQSTFFAKMILQIEKIIFIKRNALSKIFLKSLDNDYNIYFDNVIKSQKFYYAYSSLESIITIISNLIIFIIGGRSVINNHMSIGNFTIIFSYFSMVLNHLKYFTSLGSQYQANLASYSRIRDIYKMRSDTYINKKNNNKSYKINDISCSNINFSRSGITIINNFTYSFNKGNSYCIHGNNGTGKSTLLDIIIGLYNNQYEGSVKYNDIDIKKLDMNNIRRYNISLLEQDTDLINGDIKQNIFLHEGYIQNQLDNNTFNNPDIFFNFSFKRELNNYINNISGGELQKIGILRLLSKKSSLFILDEPTNSLDQESIKLLKSYINYLKIDNIVILVTHDPKMIEICDYKIKLS